MSTPMPPGTTLKVWDAEGKRWVSIAPVLNVGCACGYCDWLRNGRRREVPRGHELVLPERARSDHR